MYLCRREKKIRRYASTKNTKEIQEYHLSGSNKVLLLDGARQIGKSYIIRYEGKKHFKNYIEINFLVDDYNNLSALPIEVKSGRDFRRHRALDKFIDNKDYNIKNAILLSNDRSVAREGK